MIFIFWSLIPWSFWLNWSGSSYPVFHGGYFMNFNGQSQPQEYPYWHAQYLIINDNYEFSNGDILLFYTGNVVNMQQEYANYNLNNTGIIVRLESQSHKTLWAKDIFFEYDSLVIPTDAINLKADITYWLLVIYQHYIFLSVKLLT